jgi:hypothetical protein
VMALIVPFTLAMIWKEYHEKLSDGKSIPINRRLGHQNAASVALFG